jgi:hypothetical protein
MRLLAAAHRSVLCQVPPGCWHTSNVTSDSLQPGNMPVTGPGQLLLLPLTWLSALATWNRWRTYSSELRPASTNLHGRGQEGQCEAAMTVTSSMSGTAAWWHSCILPRCLGAACSCCGGHPPKQLHRDVGVWAGSHLLLKLCQHGHELLPAASRGGQGPAAGGGIYTGANCVLQVVRQQLL